MCGERCVCVCDYICLCVCVCVSIVPSLGFFILNQRAIDSPDSAPAPAPLLMRQQRGQIKKCEKEKRKLLSL